MIPNFFFKASFELELSKYQPLSLKNCIFFIPHSKTSMTFVRNLFLVLNYLSWQSFLKSILRRHIISVQHSWKDHPPEFYFRYLRFMSCCNYTPVTFQCFSKFDTDYWLWCQDEQDTSGYHAYHKLCQFEMISTSKFIGIKNPQTTQCTFAIYSWVHCEHNWFTQYSWAQSRSKLCQPNNICYWQ